VQVEIRLCFDSGQFLPLSFWEKGKEFGAVDHALCETLTKSFPIIEKQIRVSGVFLLEQKKGET
jgi:hypothetical protein